MQVRGLGVVTLVLAVLTGAAFGQGLTGSISGLVTDPSGSGVPNAKVVVKNVATNAETSAVTDSAGFYRVLNLVAADYVVSAEVAGFRKTTTSPQTLTLAQALHVDLSLELGQVTENV